MHDRPDHDISGAPERTAVGWPDGDPRRPRPPYRGPHEHSGPAQRRRPPGPVPRQQAPLAQAAPPPAASGRHTGPAVPPQAPPLRPVAAVGAPTRPPRPAPKPRASPPPPVSDSRLLPQPPTDEERDSYSARHLWLLNISSMVGMIFILISEVRFAAHIGWAWPFVPFMLFTVVYFLVTVRLDWFSPSFNVIQHNRLVRHWKPDRYPSVDVFLPVCGEPIEVLHNTWTHVRKMAMTYPGRVVPFVMDDSADPDLAAMAEDFGFRYAVRPNRGWYKKAGNMQFGFQRSDGDFILILDADFTPRADMLNQILPYMDAQPDLAIVQTPQYFRVLDEQGWIERGAGAVQEYFYRSAQVSRQAADAAICVGTCALYRRAALDQNGGTTLIEHSEDVHTGFDLRALGWDLKYVPVALAAGVCPDNVGAFYNQQYRWCMGSMSLLTSRKFWGTEMRRVSRMSYFSGFFYYAHTALFTVVGPILPIVMLAIAPELFDAHHMVWLLPSIIHGTVIFPLWHRCAYRIEAWAVRILYGWAHFFAITDLLRGRKMGWQPTGGGKAKKNKTRRLWIGLLGWSVSSSVLWVGLGVWRSIEYGPADYALVLGAGLLHLAVVLRAVVQPRAAAE
ncbi:glycosyltransferase [Actinocorallia sp. API 0066]|uniref:glycosyltransferase family 2 protein n=1 Tax=Actinocorallia sp. API 0066 TaxID=2896846 RepID=UPI001E4D0737|nr:cellulose synthase catalytic subunit [Actinocorallia sp. API 0066]MCD0451078.1 glycosyltransferase [Actinocorallia sp. API 0066]